MGGMGGWVGGSWYCCCLSAVDCVREQPCRAHRPAVNTTRHCCPAVHITRQSLLPCRRLRFLANVDPVDVAKALNGLNPETTLVIVISKTFTTTETMLNARTVRWAGRAGGSQQPCSHQPCPLHSPLPLVTAGRG